MDDEERYNVGITHAATTAHWLMVHLWQMDPVKVTVTRAYDWRVSLRMWETSMPKMVLDRWPFIQVYCKILSED